MPHLWGREWTRRELEARVGHLSQIGGISRFVYDDGPAREMRVIEIDTGSGFVFRVHPDRALDIPFARFNGVPLAWRTAPGDVHPGLAEPRELELMRALPAGLLYTCGLTNAGPPSVTEYGEALPIHGHVRSLPAAQVGAWGVWEGDDYVMRVSGVVTQARLFREHLTLERTITAKLGEPRFQLEDVIRNAAFTPAPLMILHHMNFGAPLVSEEARVDVTTSRVTERFVEGKPDESQWQRFHAPKEGLSERVFFHDAKPDATGWAETALTNESLAPQGVRGVRIRWLTAEEPRMWEWVFLASGAYVIDLEPTNAMAPGLADAMKLGQRVLAPGETVRMALEFEVLTA